MNAAVEIAGIIPVETVVTAEIATGRPTWTPEMGARALDCHLPKHVWPNVTNGLPLVQRRTEH